MLRKIVKLLALVESEIFQNKMPTNLWRRQKRRLTKIRSKAVGSGIFGRFSNFDKCQSDVVVDYVGTDVGCPCYMWQVLVKQWPKYLTLWPAGHILRLTFLLYLIAFCSWPEVMSDVISGRFVGPVVPDNRVKFGDPRTNRSREISPEAVWGCIYDGFIAVSSDRK